MSRGSKVNLQFLDGGGEEVHHLFLAGLSAFILFVKLFNNSVPDFL